MSDLLIVSGWYADEFPHNNPNRCALMLHPDWIWLKWRKYIEAQIKPGHYFIYHSNCPVQINVPATATNWEICWGHGWAPKDDHHLDFNATLMMGAQYALCNKLDMVYIEQDCFVFGLSKAIEWAKECPIVYGFGDNASFNPGWAEQSFMWIRNDYLPEFINKLNYNRLHEQKYEWTEVSFHNLFKFDATFWPFGHGRRRPIDFHQEIFYAQQMCNLEVEMFWDKIKDRTKGNDQ